MRRLSTLLLILLFAASPVFSALAATASASDLPECCREHGAHMCSVRHKATADQEGAPRLMAMCPFSGKIAPAIAAPHSGLTVASMGGFSPLAATRANTKPRLLILASGRFINHSKRGPPALASL